MPRVSEFFGIIIAMYYNDHWPAHFHAGLHRQELWDNWDRARRGVPLKRIEPLE